MTLLDNTNQLLFNNVELYKLFISGESCVNKGLDMPQALNLDFKTAFKAINIFERVQYSERTTWI
jgi:hypothetical protein